MRAPRAVLWWVLCGALTVTAGEAEHVRRRAGTIPGVCIGSAVLLRGTACPIGSRNEMPDPL